MGSMKDEGSPPKKLKIEEESCKSGGITENDSISNEFNSFKEQAEVFQSFRENSDTTDSIRNTKPECEKTGPSSHPVGLTTRQQTSSELVTETNTPSVSSLTSSRKNFQSTSSTEIFSPDKTNGLTGENSLSDQGPLGSENLQKNPFLSPMSPELYSVSGRPLRKCRASGSKEADNKFSCPCCKAGLQEDELSGHVTHELAQLEKWQAVGKGKQKCGSQRTSLGKGRLGIENPSTAERQKALKVVQRNRKNRQRKKRGDATECPVCGKPIAGSAEELNQHVNECLNQESQELDVEATDSDDDNQSFEEYEWAGQTRVRATSGLSSLYDLGSRVTPHTRSTPTEEEEELNIDEDEEETFGPAQFAETDLIPPTNADALIQYHDDLLNIIGRVSSRMEHRFRYFGPIPDDDDSIYDDLPDLIGTDGTIITNNPEAYRSSTNPAPLGVESRRSSIAGSITTATPTASTSAEHPSAATTSTGEPTCSTVTSHQAAVEKQLTQNLTSQLEALKAHVKDLEQKSTNIKCSVCMDNYKRPLTSIQCWHVHCEQCWLQALGAKKLCPQCNLITQASDLRRIYL